MQACGGCGVYSCDGTGQLLTWGCARILLPPQAALSPPHVLHNTSMLQAVHGLQAVRACVERCDAW
jgi:hypothetical protein